MIERSPICIRMNDGTIVEHGDIVECIKTNIKYNFDSTLVRKLQRYHTQYGFEQKEIIYVLLHSRKKYLSPMDACYVDDITGETIYVTDDMRKSESIENSIEVDIATFIEEYKIYLKWNIDSNRCISDDEWNIVIDLSDAYNKKLQLFIDSEKEYRDDKRDVI